jgi:asparagine synthetase B (glutamine-hydrolysing)
VIPPTICNATYCSMASSLIGRDLEENFQTHLAGSPVSVELLIAAAYRQWGDELQAHIAGEFSVAILDHRDRSLTLMSDALGLRPLYITERGGCLHFATHLETLVNSSCTLDETWIASYLLSGGHERERTPYREIKVIEPGHTLWSHSKVDRIIYTPGAYMGAGSCDADPLSQSW